jgi:hypothetical protein
MKHLLIILFTVFVVYFAWQYAPARPKFFIKEFLSRHFFAVAAFVIILFGALFLQTANHSTKII